MRAGVVPRLQGDRERGWTVLPPFTPGEEPFAEMEEAVIAVGGVFEPAEPLRSLKQLRRRSKAPVVLVIDQFEELLAIGPRADAVADTHQPDGIPNGQAESLPDEGERFQGFLQALLRAPKAGFLVLATMRTDCLAPLQSRWPALTGQASTLTLEPIAPEDFGQLITGPADRSQLTLQPGLVERLVAESGGGDALPLLAFTLEKLWQARQARGGAVAGSRAGEWWDLTLQDYEQLGGVAGAVSTRANECWNPQTSSEEERMALREAFLEHLVSVSSDGREAKRAAPLADLPPESLGIIQRLVNDRLLVQKEGTVEIAHETLLRTWEPLKQWIAEGKEALLQCLRVKRLADDLKPTAAERQRRQALEQLAALAAAGSSEQLAVRKEAAEALAQLLAEAKIPVPLADREDAALVLALIGTEEPLRQCLANAEAPPALRRRAAESLGLLSRRCGMTTPQAIAQRQRIAAELEHWLRSDALDLLVEDEAGWTEHDARLPLLQGASRGLQLAASADLPLLGSGPGRVVPMLTLTALQEGSSLRIRTEVVTVPVWRLPLPGGEQLELVEVKAGEYVLGSPESELSRKKIMNWYRQNRESKNVDVEAKRDVSVCSYHLVRHPVTQNQWRAVANDLPAIHCELDPEPGKAMPQSLWEHYAQPGHIAVESISWYNAQEWLARLNYWMLDMWPKVYGISDVLKLRLPSENQWEVACRAGCLRQTPFHFGDTLDASWATYEANESYGAGRDGAKARKASTVGSSGLVNKSGLMDMHGQVNEWCEDSWHPDPKGQGSPKDGRPWTREDSELAMMDNEQKDWRVLRGGSWMNGPRRCRAAFRYSAPPNHSGYDVGFRPYCILGKCLDILRHP